MVPTKFPVPPNPRSPQTHAMMQSGILGVMWTHLKSPERAKEVHSWARAFICKFVFYITVMILLNLYAQMLWNARVSPIPDVYNLCICYIRYYINVYINTAPLQWYRESCLTLCPQKFHQSLCEYLIPIRPLRTLRTLSVWRSMSAS